MKPLAEILFNGDLTQVFVSSISVLSAHDMHLTSFKIPAVGSNWLVDPDISFVTFTVI